MEILNPGAPGRMVQTGAISLINAIVNLELSVATERAAPTASTARALHEAPGVVRNSLVVAGLGEGPAVCQAGVAIVNKAVLSRGRHRNAKSACKGE